MRAKAVNEEIIEQSRHLRIESNWELATRSAATLLLHLLLCATILTESTGNHLIQSPSPSLSLCLSMAPHTRQIFLANLLANTRERQLSHSTDRKCFGSCSFALRTGSPSPPHHPFSLSLSPSLSVLGYLFLASTVEIYSRKLNTIRCGSTFLPCPTSPRPLCSSGSLIEFYFSSFCVRFLQLLSTLHTCSLICASIYFLSCQDTQPRQI